MAMQLTESFVVPTYGISNQWSRNHRYQKNKQEDKLPKGNFSFLNFIKFAFFIFIFLINCATNEIYFCRSSAVVQRRRNGVVKNSVTTTRVVGNFVLKIFHEWKSFVLNVTTHVFSKSSRRRKTSV